jgi:hypothetical protein
VYTKFIPEQTSIVIFSIYIPFWLGDFCVYYSSWWRVTQLWTCLGKESGIDSLLYNYYTYFGTEIQYLQIVFHTTVSFFVLTHLPAAGKT